MTTQTKPLGVAEVRELLVRAVEEKGADYVYDGPCVYMKDGAPDCIAGHLFAYLGHEFPEDGEENGMTVGYLSRENLLPFPFEPLALTGLAHAQDAQDVGRSWGAALEAFEKAVQS